MMVGLKHTAIWRTLRHVKRMLVAPRVDELLAPEHCRSRLDWLDAPIALEAGAKITARVRLENLGGTPWAATGAKPVAIRCRWETYAGDRFAEATVDCPLDGPVYPGEPREAVIGLAAPAFVGDYTAILDFVQGGTVFADRNPESQPARVAIPVQGSRATDIDYHSVFRTANLAENHWWVVGAFATKEQYDRSSRERLGTMVQCGLTRDSRVLDVGCGTGQMAGALADYLSEKGLYHGTDIGREAIEFCDRTFRRRNFAFRRGGMTTLPFEISEGPYDAIVFFSVFTHTFADETVLLLNEVSQRVAPGGFILVDVITSPLVERAAGHRGEMILNREHFFRLAELVKLDGKIIGRWDWNRHAERILICFRRMD